MPNSRFAYVHDCIDTVRTCLLLPTRSTTHQRPPAGRASGCVHASAGQLSARGPQMISPFILDRGVTYILTGKDHGARLLSQDHTGSCRSPSSGAATRTRPEAGSGPGRVGTATTIVSGLTITNGSRQWDHVLRKIVQKSRSRGRSGCRGRFLFRTATCWRKREDFHADISSVWKGTSSNNQRQPNRQHGYFSASA